MCAFGEHVSLGEIISLGDITYISHPREIIYIYIYVPRKRIMSYYGIGICFILVDIANFSNRLTIYSPSSRM